MGVLTIFYKLPVVCFFFSAPNGMCAMANVHCNRSPFYSDRFKRYKRDALMRYEVVN